METNKGTVAGILDITAGVIGLLGGVQLLVLALGGAAVLGMVPDPEANRLAIIPLALFLPLAIFGFGDFSRLIETRRSPRPTKTTTKHPI